MVSTPFLGISPIAVLLIGLLFGMLLAFGLFYLLHYVNDNRPKACECDCGKDPMTCTKWCIWKSVHCDDYP